MTCIEVLEQVNSLEKFMEVLTFEQFRQEVTEKLPNRIWEFSTDSGGVHALYIAESSTYPSMRVYFMEWLEPYRVGGCLGELKGGDSLEQAYGLYLRGVNFESFANAIRAKDPTRTWTTGVTHNSYWAEADGPFTREEYNFFTGTTTITYTLTGGPRAATNHTPNS